MTLTLLTGASGFVGAAVARRLLAEGLTVRALVRPQSDRRNLQNLPIELVEGDLLDSNSLIKAVAGCEALFHVAADYRLWVRNPAELYRANVDGTVALMQAAQKVGVARIVYTSSVATLGLMHDGSAANEATPVSLSDMIGHYKRSKFLAEQAVQKMIEQQALPAVIVNPSTPVGPRDIKPTPTGAMIADAVQGKMPAYVDTGLNIVHVDDVATGHWLAYQHGRIGERYILGGENMTLKAILTHIAELLGRSPPRWRVPHILPMICAYAAEAWVALRGRGEPWISVDSVAMAKKKMFFSSAKAQQELGYTSRSASEALSDAVAWLQKS